MYIPDKLPVPAPPRAALMKGEIVYFSKLLPHTYDKSCLTIQSIIYLITDNV